MGLEHTHVFVPQPGQLNYQESSRAHLDSLSTTVLPQQESNTERQKAYYLYVCVRVCVCVSVCVWVCMSVRGPIGVGGGGLR